MIGISNTFHIQSRNMYGTCVKFLAGNSKKLSRTVMILAGIIVGGLQETSAAPYTVYKTDETHYKIQFDVNYPGFYEEWGTGSAENLGSAIEVTYYYLAGHKRLGTTGQQCVQDKMYPRQVYTDVDHEDHVRAIRGCWKR